MNPKNKSLLLLIGILILSACSYKEEKVADISSWKTYRNERYGFSLQYPADLQITEGIFLKGTKSEHYSINFSKGLEYGSMVIAPDSTNGSRPVAEAESYEETIGGKKAFIEEWPSENETQWGQINLKFTDSIDKWKPCDQSEFCNHIEIFAREKSNLETFRKMLSTIKF